VGVGLGRQLGLGPLSDCNRHGCEGIPAVKGRDRYIVRTAKYWLRRAARARLSAEIHPEDKDALENLAEIYEQMAERLLKIESLHGA
jgi:hypothetical protein